MPMYAAAPAALLLLLGAAAALPAQESSPRPGDSSRIVVIQEKSVPAARVLEAFVPGAGFAYAGGWARGILPSAVRVAGLVVWLDSELTAVAPDPPCDSRCAIGVGMLAVGTAWAVFDAGETAKRTNARRRAAIVNMSLHPPKGGGSPLAVRVAVGW